MDAQLLRSTAEADAWISQFQTGHRATAALLLESLTLVSRSEFESGLLALIRDIRGQVPRPIPLFAAREPEQEEAEPNRDVQNGDADSPVRSRRFYGSEAAPYFDPLDDTVRPNAVRPGAGVGSEGRLANLIRDIVRNHDPKKYLDHPSIHSMRSVKSRQVFLVDDIIGSGKRAMEFADSFVNHTTIKSWHSRRHLTMQFVVFAATTRGQERVRGHKYVSDVFCARELTYGARFWTPSEREAVEDLCRAYAPRTSAPGIPIGFGDAFALLIFEDKCPNDAPPILWASSKSGNWKALFRQRPSMGFPVWPVPRNERERRQDVLHRIGQQRLSESSWEMHVQPDGRPRLMLLAAVAKRLTRPSVLSEIVGLTETEVTRLLAQCVSARWLTADHVITGRGLAELSAARKLGFLPDEEIGLRTDFYFPRQLRAAGDST